MNRRSFLLAAAASVSAGCLGRAPRPHPFRKGEGPNVRFFTKEPVPATFVFTIPFRFLPHGHVVLRRLT